LTGIPVQTPQIQIPFRVGFNGISQTMNLWSFKLDVVVQGKAAARDLREAAKRFATPSYTTPSNRLNWANPETFGPSCMSKLVDNISCDPTGSASSGNAANSVPNPTSWPSSYPRIPH